MAIALVSLTGCSERADAQGGPPQAPPVSVGPAVQRSLNDSEEFSGRLEAARYIELRPRVSGTIDEVRFVDGAFVRRGDPLPLGTPDLFPRVSLAGLIGFASNRLTSLGESGSQQYSLAAGLIWPLLDFGRVRSRIAASEARALQALAGYEQTVAVALEETEGALSQFSHSAEQTARLASAARSAEDAARLSKLRFDAGAVDLLIVLDAERQSLAARDALVQAQVGQATALVSVYRALGGGWSEAPAATVAAR